MKHTALLTTPQLDELISAALLVLHHPDDFPAYNHHVLGRAFDALAEARKPKGNAT